MAEKATTKPPNFRSSSTFSASASSNHKMQLRVKRPSSFIEEKEKSVKVGKKPKTKQKQKKSNVKLDPKKPKKPPTAFFYFMEDFRKEFQEKNPDIKSMREIGKACGEKWKTMTYEEKVQYYDIATEKRAEFDRAMAEYIKRKESDEESDEDQEFDSEFDE